MSRVLACLTVLSLTSAGVAFAQGNNTPANPNCTQAVRGCENYYATSDHSDQNPLKGTDNPADHSDQSQTKNYPTTDHSDDSPLHTGSQVQH